MRPDEERPAGSGNSQRAYDEAAPSESISTMLQRAVPWLDVERARRRARLRDDVERSKASRRLNALVADMREARHPSTYLLTEAELRAYANALVRDGWTVDEVLARLDLPRPRARA